MSNELIQKMQEQIDAKQQSSQDALLKQQMANAQSLQKTIDNVQDNIACGKGTQCYFQKHSAELEAIYKSKQTNKATAPEQLAKARKNYYVFSQGEAGFQKEEQARLSTVADKMIGTLKKAHTENVDNINTAIGKYNYALKYHEQLLSELERLYEEDKELAQKIDDEIAGLKTADRKVYYENNEIEGIDLWVTVLTGLYWLIFAIFAGLFIIRSLWKDKKYIAILIGLIAWPFVGNWIVGKIITLIQKLVGMLPKNVYRDASRM